MPDLLADLRPSRPADDAPARQLRRFSTDLLSGTGRAVWIEGPPGAGKTALLESALIEASAIGCRVAGSSADRPGPRLRLNPIMECLGLDPTSRDLRRILSAPSAQLVPEPRLGSRASGGIAAERLLGMFVQLCSSAPLVVAIDDLHRADPASIRFWGRLAEKTADLPLLLLATGQPEPGRTGPAATHVGSVLRIELPPPQQD
jgi:hypothetical protein